jgi:hypothetical protein
MGSIDYTSFIFAIAACLSDESPEVVQSATDTLNELAKTNPVAVARTLVTEVTSGRVGVDINCARCIAMINAIVRFRHPMRLSRGSTGCLQERNDKFLWIQTRQMPKCVTRSDPFIFQPHPSPGRLSTLRIAMA